MLPGEPSINLVCVAYAIKSLQQRVGERTLSHDFATNENMLLELLHCLPYNWPDCARTLLTISTLRFHFRVFHLESQKLLGSLHGQFRIKPVRHRLDKGLVRLHV